MIIKTFKEYENLKSNLQDFIERYKLFSNEYYVTNGDPIKDYTTKIQQMINDFINENFNKEDIIVRNIYTNSNGLMKFYTYNKKENTICIYKMKENDYTYGKFQTSIMCYEYDSKQLGGFGKLIKELKTKWSYYTRPNGKYVASIGVGNGDPHSMITSEIQEFYTSLTSLMK